MSLETLLNPKSEEEIRADIAAELASRGVSDVGFEETSTARRLLDVDAKAQARQAQLGEYLTRAGSTSLILEIPEDEGLDAWVDLKAAGRKLTRDPATKATHRCLLTNAPTGVPRTISIGQLRARAGSIDFVNIGAGSLPPGTSTEIDFRAEQAGVIGNVAPGKITQLVTTLAGVTINNPAQPNGSSVIVAARDRETNQSLVDRMDARWDDTSSGSSKGAIYGWIDAAFRYAATPKTVTKWIADDENPNGPGSVDCYVANAAGGASPSELAIIDAYAQSRWVAGTGPLRFLPAINRTITYTATLKTNNANAIADAIAADARYTAELPIGATVIRNQLIEYLMNISGMTNLTIDLQDTPLQKYENAIIVGTHSIG